MPSKYILTAESSYWKYKSPFVITGYTFTGMDLLTVSISRDGITGRGEAAGLYYFNETGASMLAQVEAIRPMLEQGISRSELRELLPAGGARNAVDCALWDFEAKQQGKSIWELTNLVAQPTHSVMTLSIDTPEAMARAALQIESSHIKVKLDGHQPLERITAICAARPDAKIVVDVNQGWNFEQLLTLAPAFSELGVAMLEQPLPRGADEALENYEPPIMLCADESCLDTSDFEQAARRYQMINIKLDKTGGLTEALDLAQLAKERDLALMVGNMVGTSLAMAPAYVVAQLCRFVDIDGMLFLTQDREHAMRFEAGLVSAPSPELWG